MRKRNEMMEPQQLRTGQRVRIRLSERGTEHGHLAWEDGATGVVVDFDDTVDSPAHSSRTDVARDWSDRLPGHSYRVRFESPLPGLATRSNGRRVLVAVEEFYTRDELELLS